MEVEYDGQEEWMDDEWMDGYKQDRVVLEGPIMITCQ